MSAHGQEWVEAARRADAAACREALDRRAAADGRVSEERALSVAQGALEAAGPEGAMAAREALVGWVLDDWTARLSPRFGRPERVALAAVGLGASGDGSLGASEPLDLVWIHAGEGADDETVGGYGLGRRIAAREWYERLTNAASRTLSRVGAGLADATLRPGGRRLHDLSELAEAYERAGHGWERLAWIPARPLAGDLELGARAIEALEPFVYPRSLSDGEVDEIAAIKALLGARTGQDREGLLARLRYVVRALQSLFGGRSPEVRARPIAKALTELARCGAMPETDADALVATWERLRAGPPSEADVSAVSAAFGAIFPERNPGPAGGVGRVLDAGIGRRGRQQALAELGFRDPGSAAHRVARLMRRVSGPFHPRRLLRDDGTAWALTSAVASCADPDGALAHLDRLVLSQPSAALEQIAADTTRLSALTRLFASSSRLSRQLLSHPERFDRLLLSGVEPRLKSPAAMAEEAGASPVRLREAEHLRVAHFELSGALEPHEVSAQLAGVADAVVRVLTDRVAPRGATGTGPWLGVVALGRWGRRTLSYHTALELAFVHDGSDPAWATRGARQVVRWLTRPSAHGVLYELQSRAEVWTLSRLEALVASRFERLRSARLVTGPDALAVALDALAGELPAAPSPSARLDAPLWDGRFDLRVGLAPVLEAEAEGGADPPPELADDLRWFRRLENALGILHDTPVGALPVGAPRDTGDERRASVIAALVGDLCGARARHAAMRTHSSGPASGRTG